MNIQKTYWQNSESSMTLAFPIAKVNKEKRTVSGFASLDNLDRHGDIVTAEASKRAFESFRGNIREMHGPSAVGKMLEFKEDTFFDKESGKKYSGVYVTAYISKGAQDAWEKCLDGTYTGFSIGGNIIDAKMEKSNDSEESRRVIHNYDLHELSLVDSPANPLANIFSIQKMAEGMVTENVFWCASDEVSSTSTATTKDCVVCGDPMNSIGWVEQADIEKFEAIENVIDSYFKKDDAPTSSHAATESAAPGNVVDSTTTINTYPDQNEVKTVSPIDVTSAIKKNEGGNEMTEDTNAEVTTEVTEVEAPAAEETAVAVEEASEFTGEEIEKAVAISEVEDTLDFSKMVGDLKTFFNDSIEKNYSNQSASIRDVVKMVQDAKEEMTKSIDDLKTKNEELTKTITDMHGKIEYVDHQLKGFESATAVKKSSDLNGSMEETKIQKSIWQGHFLGVNSLTK
jgi:phage head maturation protease